MCWLNSKQLILSFYALYADTGIPYRNMEGWKLVGFHYSTYKQMNSNQLDSSILDVTSKVD